MTDITMCRGGRCYQKEKCIRYTAIPNEYRQAFFVTPPYQMDGCPYFWSNNPEGDEYERPI